MAVLVLPAVFVFYDVPSSQRTSSWCSERGMSVKRLQGSAVCVEPDTRRLVLPPE
ncbi:MAG: hypothetical protein K0Q60_1538 [Microvirga sp.]|nr:hypothetical protein [Microvirga sp.]